MIKTFSGFVLAASLALAGTGAASAKDPQHASQPGLPGVDSDYSIVRPMPEPDDFDPQAASQFLMGDMDVRIGGSVTVDISAGGVPAPRR